jgi:hypothetical protein
MLSKFPKENRKYLTAIVIILALDMIVLVAATFAVTNKTVTTETYMVIMIIVIGVIWGVTGWRLWNIRHKIK